MGICHHYVMGELVVGRGSGVLLRGNSRHDTEIKPLKSPGVQGLERRLNAVVMSLAWIALDLTGSIICTFLFIILFCYFILS